MKHWYLIYIWSDKFLKGTVPETVVNRELSSLNGEPLEFTRSVPETTLIVEMLEKCDVKIF